MEILDEPSWRIQTACERTLQFPVVVDARVKAMLANSLLLQVDVTANDVHDKAMLKRFGLFGPPGIILFGRDGQEIAGSRVIGFQNAETFAVSLEKLK